MLLCQVKLLIVSGNWATPLNVNCMTTPLYVYNVNNLNSDLA